MKNTSSAGKLRTLMIAVAAVATGYFAFMSASQAGWFYGPNGWTYCNFTNNVEWCQ